MKGNGYCRSEGVVVIFIQSKEQARRIHLEVLDIMDNCDGFKKEGISTYADTPKYMRQKLISNNFQQVSML